MTQLAAISIGASEYDERFQQILVESGLEPQEFEGLDYFSYLPFFVIAGASVTPRIRVHGDHTHFEGAVIDVPEDQVEIFYDVLPQLLEMIGEAEGDDEQPAGA
jgi:hypothetical protein